MRPKNFHFLRGLTVALTLCLASAAVSGGSGYGIAMYGAPALPPDFVSLPYANPRAPKGGTVRVGDVGSFDSLNPFTIKGRAPWPLSHLTVETLLARSYDEPFTLYARLAESVRTGPKREWVEFTLDPRARFSDGKPVTVEDVLWSFAALAKSDPRYAGAWKKVSKAEQTGPRSVRFTFNTEDRELPLILGLRPVLEKAQWQGRDLSESTLMAPIGSGPYVVSDFKAGRYVVFKRNPDWWGRDLPVNRGRFNFDMLRYEYFGNANAMFEAFKAGTLDFFRESSAAKWATNFNFPAVRAGGVVLDSIPNGRPSGIAGLVMNTRRSQFADWRVRQALIDAFDFNFINKTVNGGAEPRITSYFSNSELGMRPGPATGRVKAFLAPFADQLLPGAMAGYSLAKGDGPGAARRNIRAAMKLLGQAGWRVEGGVLKNAAGQPFTFEILLPLGAVRLPQGAGSVEAPVEMFVQMLKRLGIKAHITTVDNAQYVERTNKYDFDMTWYFRALSLSPGNEQWLYWGHRGVTEPGTGNWMGMNSPAAEAMISAMLGATLHDDFVAATRALDRVLTTGRHVIPFWYSDMSHIARSRQLKYPSHLPVYGDWPGFFPDVWWHED